LKVIKAIIIIKKESCKVELWTTMHLWLKVCSRDGATPSGNPFPACLRGGTQQQWLALQYGRTWSLQRPLRSHELVENGPDESKSASGGMRFDVATMGRWYGSAHASGARGMLWAAHASVSSFVVSHPFSLLV